MFLMRNVKCVKGTVPGKKTILLNPEMYRDVTSAQAALEEDIKQVEENSVFEVQQIELCYDNWSAEEVLKAILPDDVPNVTGFSMVGHVAHLNLRDVHSPFKSVIGQVLLDKHKNLKTVVNKTDSIDNTYRNFSMEVLAGKNDLEVTVTENGCTYRFDFSKVYWNSRLGTEHERIVSGVTKDTVVYDIFAGVGPFSVPAAKIGATVICNDLNPHSYQSLCTNMVKNKAKGSYTTHNMDGRKFIEQIVKSNIATHLNDSRPILVIMNLPAMAIDFLDSFIGLLSDLDRGLVTREPPTVCCYCFSKVLDQHFEEDVSARINKILPAMTELVKGSQCRRVRNVAPNKEMMCAEFSLDWDVIFRKQPKESLDGFQSKRVKLDTS